MLSVAAELRMIFGNQELWKLANCLLTRSKVPPSTATDSNFKTELCERFERTGRCHYGNQCHYAHGKDELKTKLCKSWMEGTCKFGNGCRFTHGTFEFLLTRVLREEGLTREQGAEGRILNYLL